MYLILIARIWKWSLMTSLTIGLLSCRTDEATPTGPCSFRVRGDVASGLAERTGECPDWETHHNGEGTVLGFWIDMNHNGRADSSNYFSAYIDGHLQPGIYSSDDSLPRNYAGMGQFFQPQENRAWLCGTNHIDPDNDRGTIRMMIAQSGPLPDDGSLPTTFTRYGVHGHIHAECPPSNSSRNQAEGIAIIDISF